MSGPLLIKNARLVNEGVERDADVLIRSGRIEQVASGIAAPANAEVLDAAGLHLLPGMIDDQVHFRDPGLTRKGDIASESRAAVAGGITSYMDMPNVLPQTVTREALADKYARAASISCANFAFYLGATNDNLDEIRRLVPGEACGVKVFMGASTGNMLVDDEQTLAGIFADCPLLIATHCEHTPTILDNERRARERFGEDVPMSEHPEIRSVEACYRASELAVSLARTHRSRLHVLHLTTAREMELFDAGPPADKRITAEVCVHHLWFHAGDYARLGTRIKCNPAIKTGDDREALRSAVREGRIDVIATDHAPHLAEEKAGTYFSAPAGLPLVQHALVSMLELHREGIFALPLIVEKVAHAPAIAYGVRDRGFVREGYWADLVLVDLDRPWTVAADNVLYKCGWSPFEGVRFSSQVRTTLINGEIAWHDGAPSQGVRGRRLEFIAAARG